jgi:hypothetical protein
VIKLIDARWFQIFLCLRWNNMNFLSLLTRSKNREEIELQQGTPELGGADITATVPCTYVMHLWDVKRTSGVSCL